MPERILVADATHTGSTAEVATEVGEQLRDRGFVVQLTQQFKHLSSAPAIQQDGRACSAARSTDRAAGAGSSTRQCQWQLDTIVA